MAEKIVVGMSGGVDSSMSVFLLKKAGWQPVGVSLKLAHWENKCNKLGENVCCTEESLAVARNVCKRLGVRHYVYDVGNDFRRKVMGYFDSELRKARTPNPCVVCNRELKFSKLFEFAGKHGIRYVATGHYATAKDGKLLMPKDKNKDQTYGLCFLPKKWLRHIVFPLAGLTKEEVYRLAGKNGFEMFMKVKQSQDLCFVSGNALPKYMKSRIGIKPGLIMDEKGRIVAEHNGLHFYTIGQKTLGYYVKGFDVKNNVLLVTRNRSELFSREVILRPFNLLAEIKPKMKVMAKVRYRQKLANATLYNEGSKLKIIFDKPQEAITPGQCCAFYKGNVCLGGGIIT
ncbi:MAG: tRNA 2-thiouridine(34) synthase MnmA [Candidatus Woesearchaeota archaeon]